ncbi:MAG: S-layer homology domain-containing protein [Oscillospiraceae bacterium]|nr:S-layer homology domain-containing protein [Oscillospiraceae bacterium]
MKKRLFTLFLTLMLVVSIVGAVPVHAAQTPTIPQAVKDALHAAGAAPADDGAGAMSAGVFNLLVDACKKLGEYSDGQYVYADSVTLDNGETLVILVAYDSSENAVLIAANIASLDYYGAMMITPAAEAPFVEVLVKASSSEGIGGAYVTADYVPDSTVNFAEYYGSAADRSSFVDYNSFCISAIVNFLEGFLEPNGYTVEDMGLVAAARSFGVNNQTPFNDVRTSDYFYKPILWALKNGITQGTSTTTFSPNDTCTRAQVVTFLWRSAGSPNPKSAGNPFADVDTGSWYGKAVLWAVEQGITQGTSATTFAPNAGCTRAQVVTFLQRYMNGKASGSKNPFTDVASSAYYYNAVLWAVEKGITQGMTATTFGPDNTCTRAQIVTFLYRAAGSPAV